MKKNKRLLLCAGLALLFGPTGSLYAAAAAASDSNTPSSADYQRLEQNYQTLENQMGKMSNTMENLETEETADHTLIQKQAAELQAEKAAGVKQQAASAQSASDAAATQQAVSELYQQVMHVSQNEARDDAGASMVTIVGDANVLFTNQRGSPSNFSADISPIVLAQVNKNILIEAGFDFFTTGNSGDFYNTGSAGYNTGGDISILNLSYIVNDYVTAGGGMFAPPFGAYHYYFDPPWINPLPDDPIVFDTLTPPNEVGAYISGAVPVPKGHVNYIFYASNGPDVIGTDQNPNVPGNAPGALNFGNNMIYNNGKAVGGRVGYVPIPQFEVGYSFEVSKPNTENPGTTPNYVNALLQAVDFNYTAVLKPIDGIIRLHGAWVWSLVSSATYSNIAEASPFDDDSNGGYIQLYYQPTLSTIAILKNLGYVVRYDCMFIPGDNPAAINEQRWTIGGDYWLNPSSVVKVAYEFDNIEGQTGNDAFYVQFAVGF